MNFQGKACKNCQFLQKPTFDRLPKMAQNAQKAGLFANLMQL